MRTAEETFRYLHKVDAMSRVEQKAIPWCLTHDNKWVRVPGIMSGCYAGSEAKPCVDESTGGPDHKWWEDV